MSLRAWFCVPVALMLTACEVPDVNAPAEDDHRRGSASARVVLIEYGDYQCPPCSNVYRDVEALLAKHPDELRVVYRHFPTRRHRNARSAAEAAEAAEAQGHFWEMHAKLLESQSEWYGLSDPRPVFDRYAQQLGLDSSAFSAALRKRRFERRVIADHERGRDVGVRGAPTIFINGDRLRSSRFSRDEIDIAIHKALASEVTHERNGSRS